MSDHASEAPSAEQLADARRSGALAGGQGFPAGVCPYDPRQGGAQEILARVWLAAYTQAIPDDQHMYDGEGA